MLTLNDIPPACRVTRARPVAKIGRVFPPPAEVAPVFHYSGPSVDDVFGGAHAAPHLWEEAVEV